MRAPCRRCASAATRVLATTSWRSPPRRWLSTASTRSTAARRSSASRRSRWPTRSTPSRRAPRSMRPALALVDGEHYPAVVRAAIEQAAAAGPVVAALLLGGVEKLDGLPDYGVPLEQVDGDPGEALVEAARRHGDGRVHDLSDEPVLDERS